MGERANGSNGAAYPPRGPYAPRRNGAHKAGEPNGSTGKPNGNDIGKSFFGGNTNTARIEREARVIRGLMDNGMPMLRAVQKVAKRVVEIDDRRGTNGRKPNGR
jgi:hypothetical protein